MKMKKLLTIVLSLICMAVLSVPADTYAATKKTKATATVSSFSSITKNSVKVKYKVSKVKKAKYQYTTDKKFKKGVKTITVTTNGKTKTSALKGLKAGTKYYFRVKGVLSTKTEKKKYTVAWSKIKSFTTVMNFKLKSSALSLEAGKTAAVSSLTPSGAKSSDVKWTTSNSKVASVSGGKIIAKTAGTATITATWKGQKSTVKVTVKAAAQPTTQPASTETQPATDTQTSTETQPATNTQASTETQPTADTQASTETQPATDTQASTETQPSTETDKGETTVFALKKNTVTIRKGGGVSKASLLPDGVDESEVTWASSDSTIATNDNDEISGEKAGTCVFTATYKGQTATIEVIVEAAADDSDDDEEDVMPRFYDDIESRVFNTGNIIFPEELIANPSEVEMDDITWSTSDQNVAVFFDGNIETRNEGTCVVTATYKGESISVTITVKNQDGEDTDSGSGSGTDTGEVNPEDPENPEAKPSADYPLKQTSITLTSSGEDSDFMKFSDLMKDGYSADDYVITSTDEDVAFVSPGEIDSMYPGTCEIHFTPVDNEDVTYILTVTVTE